MKCRYYIDVWPEETGPPTLYTIDADSEDDARLIAFILDGGMEAGKVAVDHAELALVQMYTRVTGCIEL